MRDGCVEGPPVTGALLFCLGQGLPLVLGLPLAASQRWRVVLGGAWPAASYLVGSVVLTVSGILLSAFGLPWTLASLALAGGSVSALAAYALRGASLPRETVALDIPRTTLIVLISVAVYAFMTTATTVGNSVDYTFFWGTKAQLFASSRGIDFGALARPFFNFAHSTYPPLWPTVMAVGAMVAGRFPWRLAPMLTPLWVLLGVPVVFVLLRHRMSPRMAGAATAFWYLSLSASMVFSYSGGNAEAALVVFETVAVLALMVAKTSGSSHLGYLASLCLAGAVLTKLEGMVGAVLILGGFALALFLDEKWKGAIRAAVYGLPALGVWLLWLAARVSRGLPVSDPLRERLLHLSLAKIGLIVPAFVENLQVGSLGVAWLVPLVVVTVFGARRWRSVLPAMTLCFGLLVFSFVYYLHVHGDVRKMIAWTLPRLAQPALSAWILGAALAVAGPLSASHEQP